MNRLNILTRTYALLRNYEGIPYWALTPLRKFVRYVANKTLPTYLAKPRMQEQSQRANIVVSFTSFPGRISGVWQVVESLKNQSVLPEKIILWLSKKQFPTKESVPSTLWDREDSLFEVRMVDDDIRSHKKYYYIMKEYPDKTFVTCDDDIYYHPDMLKHLVDTSRLYPNCIIANNARRITFDQKGALMPYNKWREENKSFRSQDLIQIGAGGVLYPPQCLHKLTLRKDLFWTLTPMADDIWLNCMARLNKTAVVKTDMRYIPLVIKSDAPSLSAVNKGQGKNDQQLKALREYLKENNIDIYTADYHVIGS